MSSRSSVVFAILYRKYVRCCLSPPAYGPSFLADHGGKADGRPGIASPGHGVGKLHQ